MARGSSHHPLSPLRLLFRASQRADRLFVQAMREVRLSPRQFAVLQAVAAKEGLSQTDIMAATSLDRASTADHVRRLVAAGWLRRRRTRRDTRVYAVRVTPEGRKALALGESAARAADADLLRHIEPTKTGPVLEALRRMAEQVST
jgi:MarR family transcriptional regulator, temperature-dependent positive regulator of motility